jgi:hypothetical protein
MSVQAVARQLPRSAFRSTTWKQGSRGALCSRFAMLRVDAGHADGGHRWLLIEWPDGEKALFRIADQLHLKFAGH